MTSILYVLAAIVVLGVIVAVHEFGHYLVGRLTGMGILEYAIGMGPKIFGFKKNGIQYSLRAIPFGGFCAFLGEDEKSDDPRAMRNQPVWKRLLTVAAGPIMNFVLAFVVLVVLYWSCGVYMNAPLVHSVAENSVAQQAGLMAGDAIVAVGDEAITQDADGMERMIALIQSADDTTVIELTVDRNGEEMLVELTPEWNEEAQAYQIGIYLGAVHTRLGFFESVRLSGPILVKTAGMMLDGLRQLFVNEEVFSQTLGPVGIISTVSQDMSQGIDMALNWIVIISLNLGIMNLLPVPGLDGGRLLFLIIEGIRRKPIPTDKEAWVHAGGLILVLGFIVVITFKDVWKIFAP